MNWSQIFKAATPEEREQILILFFYRLDPPPPDYSLTGQFHRFPRPIRTGMLHSFVFLLCLGFFEFPPRVPFIAIPMVWILSLTATLTLMSLSAGGPPRRQEVHWV